MPPLPRRDLRNLVRKLGAECRPGQRAQALVTIATLCYDAESLDTIAAAGAIPPLVLLLRSGSPPDVQSNAATVLSILAEIAPGSGPFS
ncbi:hypothetical protein FOA52_014686 [Chlamydomonas sp. UWO 241]|nr:hypothetical protein FOA52_014686 [Chlamydomonas sp. UWO 241]